MFQSSAQKWRESPIEVVIDGGVGGLWFPPSTPSHSAWLPCWVPPKSAALWNVSCSPLSSQCWHVSCPLWVPLCSSLRAVNQQGACSSFCGCRIKLITNTLVPCLDVALHWERFTIVSDLAAASSEAPPSWIYSAKSHTCTAANPGDSLDLKGMMTDLHQGNRSMFKSKLDSLGFVNIGN